MDMIRHDREGVQKVMAQHVRVVVNGFRHHVRHSSLAEIKRSRTHALQQPVECSELPAGAELIREEPMRRQAIMQAPSNEDWRTYFKDMG